MEYIVVLIPVLLIVIMGWNANEGKGGYFQGDRILGNKRSGSSAARKRIGISFRYSSENACRICGAARLFISYV